MIDRPHILCLGSLFIEISTNYVVFFNDWKYMNTVLNNTEDLSIFTIIKRLSHCQTTRISHLDDISTVMAALCHSGAQ